MRYVVIVYVANVLAALPLAAALRMHLRDDLGHSIAAENLRQGWDDLWHRGFSSEAHGLAATFDASVVGIGAVLNALDDLLTGTLLRLPPALVAAGLAYLVVWVFFAGGFVTRAAARDSARPPFFASAARHFPRFAAITGLAGGVHLFVFGALFGWLSSFVDAVTYEVVDERVHFAWTLGKYLVLWSFVWTVSLVSDYAKIASVLDPEVSLAGAWRRAIDALLRHARRVYGVSLGIGVIGLGVVGLYGVIAPGPGQSDGFWIAMAFVVSQTYVIARVALRTTGYAAQTALGPTVLGGAGRADASGSS